MNSVVLIGRLTKDPELRYIPGTGTAVSTFTLAVNRDFTKKDGTREADFIPIEVMGKAAEFCANYLRKGRLVACNGQLRIENYQTQTGEWKNYTKVTCRQVDALEKKDEGAVAIDNALKNSIQQNTVNYAIDNSINAIKNANTEYDFEPAGLDPNAFGAIDDTDIPF